VFRAFLTDELDAVSDQLLGPGWHSYDQHPQALISFPQEAAWELPHKVWHFDLPARGQTDHLPAVRFFGFANRVVERGGGTLVVSGSHELVRRLVEASPSQDFGQSADVRRELRRVSPWFAALAAEGGDRIRQFMVDGDEVDGVRVRVVELTGEAGDVVVMHPWVFHNISQNTAERPRMMMSHTVYARDSAFFG
jgi:ectoine hydroxylase-related dioxygenase (phytanoyl-CoA dioxygenase family)